MLIRNESIGHFINFLKAGTRFAQVGYSDAEWYSILGERLGTRTALGQVIDADHGKRLLSVIERRHKEPGWHFAVPRVLWTLPGFAEGQIDWLLGSLGIRMEAVERDLITDGPAERAGLYPFIRQLQGHRVYLVGPEPIKAVKKFLPVKHHVEIETPNLHMATTPDWSGVTSVKRPTGIEDAAERYAKAVRENGHEGLPCVCLVSAGVSAAVIVDLLWDDFPDHSFYDCGSMWDAFAGIGGQREWRAKLYRDPEAWERWKRKNLTGKDKP